ncbi:DUF1120 domain-containing protein [Citrobacter youngae]|uniref:Fimbrial protein n=1 Tax=Citrobacter youngae ATCC 29220 TaxID=500640 RepID=D4BGR9_9ENTR|nr:DUF1120 domain-containing protein [Citrobacter youngae]EFE06669.1 hypothetical protein CIT292_09719 [Citrobacter youngae ATCC 29220]
MKKTLITVALLICAGSTFADTSTLLKVNGKLTNAACAPELEGGGIVDYGYVHLSGLSASEDNILTQKKVKLTINCTAPTKVSFSATDDRADSRPAKVLKTLGWNDTGTMTPAPAYVFGVGTTTEGVKIGNYALVAVKGTVDGKSTYILRRTNNSAWGSANDMLVANTQDSEITVAEAGGSAPASFNTATFTLKVNLTVEDTDTLNITDDTPIDGQTTFTLNYL